MANFLIFLHAEYARVREIQSRKDRPGCISKEDAG